MWLLTTRHTCTYMCIHTCRQNAHFSFFLFFLIWQGGWSNGSVVQRTYYLCRGPGFDLKNPPGSSQMSDTQEIKSLKTANKKIIFSVSIFWEMWGCKMAKSKGQARYFVCQQFFRSREQLPGTSYLIIVTTMLSVYIHFLHNFSLPFSFPHFTFFFFLFLSQTFFACICMCWGGCVLWASQSPHRSRTMLWAGLPSSMYVVSGAEIRLGLACSIFILVVLLLVLHKHGFI